MNAKEFLETLNIDLKSTTLVVHIDGHNRQPDLCNIMDMYANHKLKSIIDTLNNFGVHIPNKFDEKRDLQGWNDYIM
jgi:hypothetical protein